MRNRIGIIMIGVLCTTAFGGVYSGGAGEPNEPFIIASANDLQQIAYEPNDWNKCFKMVADVDLAELGRDFYVIAQNRDFPFFAGVFDGDGHTVSNFRCDASNVSGYNRCGGVGLFYCISGETAEVKNLGIVNADISNLDNSEKVIATLAGEINRGAKVTNCYAENCRVTNACRVGGLVGMIFWDGAMLSNCYTSWDVTGGEYYPQDSYVGGLAYRVDDGGIISNCYTTGNITGPGTVGGLVAFLGEYDSFLIEDCYTTGNVSNAGAVDYNGYGVSVGGLVGRILRYEGEIRRCYSTGMVSGGCEVGGLIGSTKECSELKIIDSYAEGGVNVLYCEDYNPLDYGDIAAGGLIGLIEDSFDDGEITNCHATGDVNFPLLCVDHGGNDYAGGLIGGVIGYHEFTIKDCNATGNVSSTCDGEDWPANEIYTGGLIGYCERVEFENCSASGNVSSISDGEDLSVSEVYTGGLVGYCERVEFENCNASGDVTGNNYTGGLVGYSSVILEDCYATGDVSGNDYVGGLIGYGYDFHSLMESIKNCYATGNVNGDNYVGGLGGKVAGIYKCYATGNVNGIDYVGGLGGKVLRTCDCYARGDVNGIDYVGGFAGAVGVEIYNCYSTGKINYGDVDDVNNVGGFIGFCKAFHSHCITDCFWDIEASGMEIGVGFVEGDLLEPLDVYGKNTTEMKDTATFVDAGWDFVAVWGIGDGQTYPYLRQYSVADVSRDGVVNFVDFAILADSWLVEKYFFCF